MSKLIELYRNDIKNKKFFFDKEQELIIEELNILTDIILQKNKNNKFIFSSLFSYLQKKKNFGLYIYGDVGRGKTYLVDLFFQSLDITKKIRLHYHSFMKLIHIKLKEFEGTKNPLKTIAKWFKKNYLIICLDEFFVKDITDAMQLSNLFKHFFEYEIYIVITSNVIPNKLYEGGLQRQKFIPTITLIEKYLKIIKINNKKDYRYYTGKTPLFLPSLSFKSFKIMKNLYIKISQSQFQKKKYIEILGRKIKTLYISKKTIWLDFKIICGTGRSQLDYIELATSFKTIFLSGVFKMNKENDDIARRFIALIDELYDKRVNIIISATDKIDNLYSGDILKFDFNRTISRLNEMLTKNYSEDFN